MTDIAVLEHWECGEWTVLAYIGPDREGGRIDDTHEDSASYNSCNLRIRYLNGDADEKT